MTVLSRRLSVEVVSNLLKRSCSLRSSLLESVIDSRAKLFKEIPVNPWNSRVFPRTIPEKFSGNSLHSFTLICTKFPEKSREFPGNKKSKCALEKFPRNPRNSQAQELMK